jgi:hypothetical protein
VSFDLAVLSSATRLDADQARDAYERLCQGADWSDVLAADDRVGQFVAALSARWPDIDTVPESKANDSPWSGGFEVSPAHVLMTMRFSAPDAVVEFCLTTALGLGLYFFDPQDGTLYSRDQEPRRATPRPRKTLACERCGKPIDPGAPYAEFPKVLHMACLLSGSA